MENQKEKEINKKDLNPEISLAVIKDSFNKASSLTELEIYPVGKLINFLLNSKEKKLTDLTTPQLMNLSYLDRMMEHEVDQLKRLYKIIPDLQKTEHINEFISEFSIKGNFETINRFKPRIIPIKKFIKNLETVMPVVYENQNIDWLLLIEKVWISFGVQGNLFITTLEKGETIEDDYTLNFFEVNKYAKNSLSQKETNEKIKLQSGLLKKCETAEKLLKGGVKIIEEDKKVLTELYPEDVIHSEIQILYHDKCGEFNEWKHNLELMETEIIPSLKETRKIFKDKNTKKILTLEKSNHIKIKINKNTMKLIYGDDQSEILENYLNDAVNKIEKENKNK